MTLRGIVIFSAVALLSAVGCGDDITNIIEEVVVTQPPVTESPAAPTTAPVLTATPTPIETEDGTPTNTPDGLICGNGVVEAPEQCDIGGICIGGSNDLDACTAPADCPGGRCTVVGGQPTGANTCAANCTFESIRTAPYGAGTGALVQTGGFRVPVNLSGSQTVQTGAKRDDDTVDINGEVTFRAGDFPLITKAPDIRIDPASVPGLVCACVRGIEVPAFGPGNSATGLISCGGELEGVDYLLSQDHRTDPLEDFAVNAECSHPADPECDDEFEIVTGVVSRACREGSGADCLDHPHRVNDFGVCNGSRQAEYFGSGPVGSAIIFNNTAIGLLRDGGACDESLGGMSPCPREEQYGPDCLPCTDDDPDKGVPENNPTTTGTARAAVFNSNNRANVPINEGSGVPCTESAQCTEQVCGIQETCVRLSPTDPSLGSECGLPCGGNPCQTTRTGKPFDCDALMADPSGGLSGGEFAVCFPSIDAAIIADNVTCTTFAFE